MAKLNNTIMFACNQGGLFSKMMAWHEIIDTSKNLSQ